MVPELVLSLLLPLLQVASVEQGLALLEAGQPVESVEQSVGLAAAGQVGRAPDPVALRRLATLARLGGAEVPLGQALVRVVAAGQGPLLVAALEEAGGLTPEALEAGELPPTTLAALVDLLWGEVGDELAAGAVLLAGPRVDPDQLAPLVLAWGKDEALHDRAERLLAGLGRARAPLAAFDALLALGELPARLAARRGAALAELVGRSPEVADEALTRSGAMAGADDLAGADVVASLGGLPLPDEQRWRQGADLLTGLLGASSAGKLAPDLLAAALLAAAELLVPEVVADLPAALRHPDAGVRRAAAAAVGLVGYRDGPTIDLLIEALADPAPEVAEAALAALLKKTGQRLPAQADLWRRYRASAALPAQPPQGAAERLTAERQLRAEVARRGRPGVASRVARSAPLRRPLGQVPGEATTRPGPLWGPASPSPSPAALQAEPARPAVAGAPEAEAPQSALRAAAAASAALLLVGLLLAVLPGRTRGLVLGGPRARSIARDVPTDTTRRPSGAARATDAAPESALPGADAEDQLEAATVPGLSLSSASYAGLVVGRAPGGAVATAVATPRRPTRPQPLILPLGTAARATSDRTFEGLLAALPRIPRLASLAVRLTLEAPGTSEPDRRLLLLGAGQAGGLATALATLRALSPLVADVSVTLEGAPLELVVFERAPVAVAASGPSWERLLALVAQDGALFDELEVLACGVWRRVQGAGEAPGAALVRLAALGPDLVDEVRGLVKGGTRVRLHERAGRPRPAAAAWPQLLEGLQRRASALVELELDDGSGWRTAFAAVDGPRFAAARAELLDRPGGPARALLRGSSLVVDLPEDPSSRDALVDELGLEATERLELGGERLFEARDGASRARALQELVQAGPHRLVAVRARLVTEGPGDAEAPELTWTRSGAAPADTHRVARRQPEADLDSTRLDPDARERAAAQDRLARAMDGLSRLAPGAVEGLTVWLRTEVAPVSLPGGEAGLRALRALVPLALRLVVRAAGCPLELVVWEGSAAPSSADEPDAARRFLRGLEGTLSAFDSVEVREAGRLWRTVKDGATTELEALTALGALSSSAVREVRAVVGGDRGGERVTLFRSGAGPESAWTALLAELHRLAPTLESITLVEPSSGAGPRTLFAGGDAARFAGLRAQLAGWQVDRLALRVRLRGSLLELPLEGTRAEVTTALEELGAAAVETVALDEAGAAPLFEAQDAAPLGAAIGTLAALDPSRVTELRVRAAGEVERVLFPTA